MGTEISKFTQHICVKPPHYKVLILGLEGSGKTTIFDRIKSNEVYIRNPTIGFNVEQIKLNGLKVTLWDFGGHEKIMKLWDKYFDKTDLVILVIDSTDPEALIRVKDVLKMIKEKLGNIYLLILITKIDLFETMENERIIKETNLYDYGLKIAKVLRVSPVLGDGMRETENAISNTLKNIKIIK